MPRYGSGYRGKKKPEVRPGPPAGPYPGQSSNAEVRERAKRSERGGYDPQVPYLPSGVESEAPPSSFPPGYSPEGRGFDASAVAAKLLSNRSRQEDKRGAIVQQLLDSPLPGLDDEQTSVAMEVLQEGLEAGADIEELLAAVETGLVESSFRNLDYGDADSEGWRQERTSIYGTGPEGPTDVEASAERFFDELKSDPGTQDAATPGLLAQAAQGSAFPERYDEREGEARAILDEFIDRSKKAQGMGLTLEDADVPRADQPLPGPYGGSRRFVSKLLGRGVHGDKEPGHASGGMHDPANPDAYAQDIGSAGANPAEGEPPYSEQTVDRVVRKLRGMGAEIPSPKQFSLGENWEGNVDGYDVEFLTAPHGSGPHIHLGAEFEGDSPTLPTLSGSSTAIPASSEGTSAPSSDLLSAALERSESPAPQTGGSKLASIMGLLEAPMPSVRDPLQPLKRRQDELLKLALRGRYT